MDYQSFVKEMDKLGVPNVIELEYERNKHITSFITAATRIRNGRKHLGENFKNKDVVITKITVPKTGCLPDEIKVLCLKYMKEQKLNCDDQCWKKNEHSILCIDNYAIHTE